MLLQGYICRILQHLTVKLCKMSILDNNIYLSYLDQKFSLTCKLQLDVIVRLCVHFHDNLKYIYKRLTLVCLKLNILGHFKFETVTLEAVKIKENNGAK